MRLFLSIQPDWFIAISNHVLTNGCDFAINCLRSRKHQGLVGPLRMRLPHYSMLISRSGDGTFSSGFPRMTNLVGLLAVWSLIIAVIAAGGIFRLLHYITWMML